MTLKPVNWLFASILYSLKSWYEVRASGPALNGLLRQKLYIYIYIYIYTSPPTVVALWTGITVTNSSQCWVGTDPFPWPNISPQPEFKQRLFPLHEFKAVSLKSHSVVPVGYRSVVDRYGSLGSFRHRFIDLFVVKVMIQMNFYYY